MRIALFSPLPPSKSGIADYTEALLEPLRGLADVEVFTGPERPFRPEDYDIALYQIGNNPYHAHAYETALRHPGVTVLHEANLHHLVADLTIKRGDWEAYLAECEYNGAAGALAHARKVRALEAGPDYEGVPMLRRLLESSRAVIAHSNYVIEAARAQGFTGPAARIPHGAWLLEADRHLWRDRLGVDEAAPLIGVFGFLKPYKRIAESLRAFQRLARLRPDVKMILCGEEHPDFPVASLVRTLGLDSNVRLLGFTPIEDFTGYIAACDIVLNLRYPTAGESSGSMLRALGLGKPALVSDIGAFAEYPDGVCMKVPPGPGEEDIIFEYLNLLVSRPDIAQAIGERAKEYAARECNWSRVAKRYAGFLRSVAEGSAWKDEEPLAVVGTPQAQAQPAAEPPEDLGKWITDPAARGYLEAHASRLQRTLEIIPPGGPGDRILEMGAYMQITPALRFRLGYGEVRGCYYGRAGRADRKTLTSQAGESFECDIDLFDAERDRFPYPCNHFSTVLCCELIEHLLHDPMHLMAEVNRVLRPGGRLVLTTPNAASLRAMAAILQGYHPGFFSAYIRPAADGDVEARHNREYTPREIRDLLENAGFDVERLETGPFRDEPHPEYHWVKRLLRQYLLPAEERGDGIYAVGRKTGPVRHRYPAWLYA
jgi:glycosyltransferase involved in cell wall biosynthesis/SAM-dependent methyltransferase